MAQIAEKAGVSMVTVSRALRGVGRMKPATREAIRKHARRMGYPLDEAVFKRVSLSRGSGEFQPRILTPRFPLSKVDYPHPTDPSHPRSEIRQGIQQRLKHTNGTFDDREFEDIGEALEYCRRKRMTGLLVNSTLPYAWLKQLCEALPTVMIGPHDHYSQLTLDAVHLNEARAAVTLLDHLYQAGHRRIAWLGLLDKMERSDAFMRAIDPHRASDRQLNTSYALRHAAWANLAWCQPGLGNMPLLLPERDWARQSLHEAVAAGLDQLLNMRPRPTAVVLASGPMALAFIELAAERGLSVPQNLSVATYGYIHNPAMARLTHIQFPAQVLGRAAIELLERRLAMPAAVPVTMQIEAPLHPGKTVVSPAD